MSAVIHSVEKGSLAYKHKIKSGDIIEKINGREVVDYLDYMFLSSNEEIEIQLSDRTVTIINEDFEPL
ncbi:MAG: PDZ domain-containing protein, partial [Clostridia bacterium]|nr:PDZ domain-containing protein [Clostridia bacterium]